MRMTLASRYRRFQRRLGTLGKKNDGSVTVEFVLWIPVLLIILAFTADASQLYLIRADMWSVAADTARRMSTGQLTSATAQAYAAGDLLYPRMPYAYSFTQGSISVSPPVDDVVEISVPVASASVFGILALYGGFSGAKIDAKITMRSEV